MFVAFTAADTRTAVSGAAASLGDWTDSLERGQRINGHVRSGSAGNWGAAARAGHLSAYPLSSIPGGELKANMPWADYPTSRRTENNWA